MRKIIQISENLSGWSALCNDGTLWYKNKEHDWERKSDIPQDGYEKDNLSETITDLKESLAYRTEMIGVIQSQLDRVKGQVTKAIDIGESLNAVVHERNDTIDELKFEIECLQARLGPKKLREKIWVGCNLTPDQAVAEYQADKESVEKEGWKHNFFFLEGGKYKQYVNGVENNDGKPHSFTYWDKEEKSES